MWKKAQIEAPICSTDFRKGAVTEIYGNHKSYSSNLADLLDHNESTGNRYYHLSDKNNSSLRASKKLALVMRGQSKCLPKQDMFDTKKSLPSEGSQDVPVKCPSKTPWSSETEEVIKSVFKEEIFQQTVSIETVRQKIAGIPLLVDENPRRVLDKVLAQWRFSKKLESTDPEAQPPSEQETQEQRVNRMFDDEDSHNTMISPTEHSVTMKGIFSALEVKVLVKLCDDMVKTSCPIAVKVIKERLEKDVDGKNILKCMTMRQIVNRVKYERKMFRWRKTEKSVNYN